MFFCGYTYYLIKDEKMNKINIKITIAAIPLFCISTSAIAVDILEPIALAKTDKPKRQLKGDMTFIYNVLPGNVDTIHDLFSEGIFYGSLRNNTFYWDWDIETTGNNDNKAMGVGGSLIYKSAVLNGFSGTVGYYSSLSPNFFREDAADVGFVKAGKDTFSRYKVLTEDSYDMNALGQAYLEYDNGKVDVMVGRQFFESVFTASNDTKMIPNTFDGLSVGVNLGSKTTARVAWLGKQKLRDHENTHDVITFKDASGERWNNNDDIAVHQGLSYDNFVTAGENPNNELFIADIKTQYIENLDFTLSTLSVPGIINDIVIESHYRVTLENGWAVRPGMRYFYQMDNGGGNIAGYTNLTGLEALGYDASVSASLDASLFAGRVDFEMPNKKGLFRLGYSKVADNADIIAPWRGFPTGGFTRAMAQYNWYANTETYMVKAVYKFNSKWKASLIYAIQDFDDNKDFVQADSTVWHLDTWTDITKRFQMRVRIGIVTEDDGIVMAHNIDSFKPDASYNEYRLEFNYLF